MTSTSPDTRVAETESLFREVNERIAETSRRFDVDDVELVCECADAACMHRVRASVADYERVRADGARFLVAPGHEDERFERVVRERRRYRVVEKLRDVALLARRLDPRAQPST